MDMDTTEMPNPDADPEDPAVMLSWLIPSWIYLIGLVLVVTGGWIISTAPDNLEAGAWERDTSVHTGTALFILGGMTSVCAALYCTWLAIEGGYHLWRRSIVNPAARRRELAWNLIATLTTLVALAVTVISH
jgi:hypothetical protein